MADIDTSAASNPDLALLQEQQTAAIANRDAATDKLAADSSSFDPERAVGAQPTFNQATPQDHFQDVMKQAPLMMALGAIGGAFGKQHGITMLASTNAMMKGIVQGNADAYSAAREKYDQQYAEFKDKQKTWMDVYKAYSAAYKGRIDADIKAVQGANAAVGIFDRDVRMTKTQIGQTALLSKKLDESQAKVARMSSQDATDKIKADAAAKNADANQKKAATGAAAETRKADSTGTAGAEVQAGKTIDELESLIDSNAFVTGAGGTGRRLFEFVQSNLDKDAKLPATEFASKMHLLMAKVPEILKMKGKMGKDQREQINDAVSGLENATSGPQAKVKLDELKKLLAIPPTKTIDGKTYVQKDGKWYAQ
jgi:hypothetical protein